MRKLARVHRGWNFFSLCPSSATLAFALFGPEMSILVVVVRGVVLLAAPVAWLVELWPCNNIREGEGEGQVFFGRENESGMRRDTQRRQ